MIDQFTKNLIARLDQIQTVLKRSYGNNPYLENRSKLIALLLDHPAYIKQVEIWKKEVSDKNIPVNKAQDIFLWEHNYTEDVKDYISQIRSFLADFAFNNVYRFDVEQFTYDHIFCSTRNEKMSRENIPSLIIVDTDTNKNINAHLITPNSRYVQIFDWTTLKDVQENWNKIKKKESGDVLEVEIGNELLRILWQSKLQGKSVKEITNEINHNQKHLLSKIKDGILGEDNARVYIHRYGDRLKKLKDF